MYIDILEAIGFLYITFVGFRFKRRPSTRLTCMTSRWARSVNTLNIVESELTNAMANFCGSNHISLYKPLNHKRCLSIKILAIGILHENEHHQTRDGSTNDGCSHRVASEMVVEDIGSTPLLSPQEVGGAEALCHEQGLAFHELRAAQKKKLTTSACTTFGMEQVF